MMLKGKTAVVTGASRGIGEAIARKLASLGANIAVIYAGNNAAAEKVCKDCQESYGVKAVSYQCDVSDFDIVKQTVASIKADFGTVHILVNNAGITRDGLCAMMKEDDFSSVVDTNLKGAFNFIRHCSGMFLKNREGSIINIASVVGLTGNAGQSNYAASKAGLIGLTKSVAKELTQADNPLLAAVPLGRMGEVSDIAEAAAYLATANYVTGEVLRVDGGIAM